MSKNKELYLILDNIRSRENVGSIFRTADGAGVKKIFLCGITPTPGVGNPKSQAPSHKQIRNSKFSRFVSNRGSSIAMQSGQIQNSDKIHKTALGAETYVPWEYRKQAWRLLLELKSKNEKLKIIGLEQTKNSENIFKSRALSFRPLALVVGNEVRGLSPKILKHCDKVISILMFGKKESLNVSVACGIAIYTILRPY